MFLKFRKIILNGLFSLTLILLCSYLSHGQSRRELEEIRFQIIKEIDDTNQLLKETAQNKISLASDLQILNRQINNRKKLITQINKEIESIDLEINRIDGNITLTKVYVDSLQEQYSTVLRAVYRENRMRNPMVEMLSQNTFSNYILKHNYYNRLKNMLADKLILLENNRAELQQNITSLNKEKIDKLSYQKEIENQYLLLQEEQNKQQVLINSLKLDEAVLKESLAKQKQDRENMNIAIENIINSNFGTETTSASDNTAIFENGKGSLIWPVNGGIITGKFGRQPHPTVKNLIISNNGIEIRAPKNAPVMLIAPGTVVSVSELTGYGQMIIVDHNQYYTVYSKLKEIFIKKGDILEQGHVLGNLSEKNSVSELHFEIWNNSKTLNPEVWLKK